MFKIENLPKILLKKKELEVPKKRSYIEKKDKSVQKTPNQRNTIQFMFKIEILQKKNKNKK